MFACGLSSSLSDHLHHSRNPWIAAHLCVVDSKEPSIDLTTREVDDLGSGGRTEIARVDIGIHPRLAPFVGRAAERIEGSGTRPRCAGTSVGRSDGATFDDVDVYVGTGKPHPLALEIDLDPVNGRTRWDGKTKTRRFEVVALPGATAGAGRRKVAIDNTLGVRDL